LPILSVLFDIFRENFRNSLAFSHLWHIGMLYLQAYEAMLRIEPDRANMPSLEMK